MSFEDELSEGLRSRADRVDVSPDLAEVEAASGRHRRRRNVAVGGAVAVVAAVGAGGVLAVSNDGSDRIASTGAETSVPVVVPGTTLPPVPASTTTVAPDDLPATTEVTTQPAPTDAVVVPPPPTTGPPGTDPADEYLDRTEVVYERTVYDDRRIVVRRSAVSYAELFDLEWRAPTGSADVCFGEHALFIGEPGVRQPWGSAWSVTGEFGRHASELRVELSHWWQPQDSTADPLSAWVVSTTTDADEVVVVAGDGERDRAPVVDGLAVVEIWYEPPLHEEPQIVLVTDGVAGEPLDPWAFRGSVDSPYPECSPGPPPVLPLPPAGEQPADPPVAEAEIRAQHAILVDQSRTDTERLDDVLDDVTGVADAAERMRAGSLAEPASTAVYELEEFVFTSPDEAWFRYTITASTGTFAGRFGIARFDGSVWRITRDTICQDLALAGAGCQPNADMVLPPEPPDWQETVQAYRELAEVYYLDECPPLMCG